MKQETKKLIENKLKHGEKHFFCEDGEIEVQTIYGYNIIGIRYVNKPFYPFMPAFRMINGKLYTMQEV